jgi:hypothetical protein
MSDKDQPLNRAEKSQVYQDAIDLLFGGIELKSPEKVPGLSHSMVTSLVQIDGDHCMSIHQDALTLPELPRVISDQHHRLDERLNRIHTRFRKISRVISRLWLLPLSISVADLAAQIYSWILCSGKNALINFLDSNHVLLWSLFSTLILSLLKYIVPRLIRWFLFNRLEKKDQLPEKRQLVLGK